MSNKVARAKKETPITLVDIRRDFYTYPRLEAIAKEEAIAQLQRIIYQAFLYRGQQADPSNIEFIASALHSELMIDDSHLGTRYITMAEIDRVIKRAVLSTEMYGISVATIYKAIIDYINGEGKEASRKARELNRAEGLLYQEQLKPMLTSYVGEMLRKK